MAFNFFKWLLKSTTISSGDSTEVPVSSGIFLDEDVTALSGLEAYLQKIAFWTCVRKIGQAVGACEVVTYRANKRTKAREYWSWNYAPNPNQNREQFMMSLIAQLYQKQEVIVVETSSGARYVADSYSVERRLSGDIYRDISSNGESIPGAYSVSDLLHFTLPGDNTNTMLTAIASAEGNLLRSATSSYLRNNGMRGTLEIDDFAEADSDFDETYNDLINDKFKKYFTADNAVLPLFKGYHYTERESSSGKSSAADTRDIRAMMDDILDLTARAFGIPASIAQGGNVTDTDFQDFMTSTIQPILYSLEQEINRKLYGPRQVMSNGSYVTISAAGVRYRDLFDIADPIDKLVGSGTFCINEIRTRLGEAVIDEPWAWQHWMTKNYSTAQELNNGLSGNDEVIQDADTDTDTESETDTNTDTEPAEETPEEGENSEQEE